MAHRPARGRLVLAGAALVGAGLLVPSLASAATVKTNWGDFDRQGTEYLTSFPHKLTISKGDRVQFTINGFHTVVIPKKGDKPPALLGPSGQLTLAQNDPAGQPYWWAGTAPLFGFNPAAAIPAGGRTVNGKKTVNSGLLNGNAPKFTVRFTKLGTFKIRCTVHPNMRGTVTVVPKSHQTDAQRAKVGAKQKAATAKAVLRLVKKANKSKGDTVTISPGPATGQSLAFYPARRTVAVGATVTFKMSGRNEVHTVSFGPKAYADQVAKTAFQGNTPFIAGEGFYPTDNPALGVPTVTPTSHGNGFVSSGLLSDPGTGIPLPHSFSVTFPVAGTYRYQCLVHPEMVGKITVG